MSLKTRVWRLLGKLDRRITLTEDAVEQTRGAVNDMLDIGTDMRGKTARIDSSVERIERAVVELARTVADAMQSQRDEREIRAGLAKEVMRLSGRVDTVERHVEEGRPNGAA